MLLFKTSHFHLHSPLLTFKFFPIFFKPLLLSFHFQFLFLHQNFLTFNLKPYCNVWYAAFWFPSYQQTPPDDFSLHVQSVFMQSFNLHGLLTYLIYNNKTIVYDSSKVMNTNVPLNYFSLIINNKYVNWL